MDRPLPAFRLGHRPALDGIRGVAILLVVLGHAYVPGFAAGAATGVTLFFVLSGFLITSLLIEERADTGRIRLTTFYRRRILRLGPALAVFLVTMLVFGVAWQHVLAGALYVGNWVRVTGAQLLPVGHLWSLAVEEQFYLVWPLLLLIGVRGRWLLVAAGAALVLSIATPMPAYLFTIWTHIPALAVGCGLAFAYHAGWRTPQPAIASVVGTGLLLVVAAVQAERPLFAPAALASGLMLAGQLERPWLVWGPLMAAGRVSYAWYLWHFPLIAALPYQIAPFTLPFSLLIAVASWRYVERPFLRRRARLPHDEGDQRVAVTAGAGGGADPAAQPTR